MSHIFGWFQATYDPRILWITITSLFINYTIWTVLEFFYPAERGQSIYGKLYNVFASLIEIFLGKIGQFVAASISSYFVIFLIGESLIVINLNHAKNALSGYYYWLAIIPIMMIPIFITDFFYYWFHRLQHEWPWLWEIHKLHHMDTELNSTSAHRHHWLEEFARAFFLAIPLTTFFKITPAEAGFITVIYGQLAWYIHANIRLHLGYLSLVVGGPQYHRIHHSIERRHWNRNYAAYFPVWDWLFGTLHRPMATEWPKTGVEGEVGRPTLKILFFGPFIAWWSMFSSRRKI